MPRGSAQATGDTDALEALLGRIRGCRRCIDDPIGRPLPHQPRPVIRVSADTRIIVCGQAPGTRVHASGLPFDDASGDRLREWMGVDRDTFYDVSQIGTVPMGFCFPGNDTKGGDLPPRRECAKAWHAQVFPLLPAARLILLVGHYAQAYHLGDRRKQSLTDTVAAFGDYLNAAAIPRLLPLPHPSWRNSGWLKRNPWFAAELLPRLRRQVATTLANR